MQWLPKSAMKSWLPRASHASPDFFFVFLFFCTFTFWFYFLFKTVLVEWRLHLIAISRLHLIAIFIYQKNWMNEVCIWSSKLSNAIFWGCMLGVWSQKCEQSAKRLKAETLTPTPYTLHPKPYTLNPQGRRGGSKGGWKKVFYKKKNRRAKKVEHPFHVRPIALVGCSLGTPPFCFFKEVCVYSVVSKKFFKCMCEQHRACAQTRVCVKNKQRV